MKKLFLLLALLSAGTPFACHSKPSPLKGTIKIAAGLALAYPLAQFWGKLTGRQLCIFIAGFAGIGLVLDGLDDWQSPNKNSIDKAAITATIKADIFKVFRQEMWIASNDFSAMAHGNAELENDLKDLYASFGSQEAAQKKLDAFCKKWHLEKIKI